MHLYGRVGSSDAREMQNISRLLNFENEIADVLRMEELRRVLLRRLIPKIAGVESEQDVFGEIKKLPTLNGVPSIVKKHFGLPID